MDAVEFFSEFRRMCKSSSGCAKCEYHGDRCDNAIELLEKTVAMVEQWPEAWVDEDGCLRICPNGISPWHRSEDGECITADKCADCRREFWTQEVE